MDALRRDPGRQQDHRFKSPATACLQEQMGSKPPLFRPRAILFPLRNNSHDPRVELERRFRQVALVGQVDDLNKYLVDVALAI